MADAKFVVRSTSIGPKVRGSGHRVEETRELPAFDRLEVHGPFSVELRPGSSGPARLEGDDNLLPLVHLEAEGGLLTVRLAPEGGEESLTVESEKPITLALPVRDLSRIQAHSMTRVGSSAALRSPALELECHGSARVDLQVETEEVVEEAKGNAEVTLRGRTARHVARGSGSAEIHALDLVAATCEAKASGSAQVEVHATRELDARASGNARIVYRGGATVSESLSGRGRIEAA
jgi:hypothetical protein